MENDISFTSPSQIPCLGGFTLVRDTMLYSRVNEPKYKLILGIYPNPFSTAKKWKICICKAHLVFKGHAASLGPAKH